MKPAEHLTWQRVGTALIVLDTRTGRYHELNEAAAHIFEQLAEGADRADIAATLCEEFEVEPDRARSDVDRAIAELKAAGLLHEQGG